MKVTIAAVGTKMPGWVEQACNEYQKRLVGPCQLEFLAVTAVPRTKNADLAQIAKLEAQQLEKKLAAIPVIIALDRNGKTLTTEKFASRLQTWVDEAQDVALVIGGPEGLTPDYISRASESWSLSAMTMAHPVARVVMAEQVYRAWSINAGLPYHRAETFAR
ncbi:MAG: 23S rRNA (pseudouridine(1915)-N(3))-methyltransferase RlmH [Proteobacteria bacterium]|jgi:23S rRNA (pseudouridine1915-N3)-methyltransferase|nr:23S rRNA (pseudouridine(1915)-N(3))-methyltransferase RlmH [Pseudomonadota bacterium]